MTIQPDESCKNCIEWSGNGFKLTFAECEISHEDTSYMDWCHEYHKIKEPKL